MTADRPETLDLLRRDSQMLERALQEAGLKPDSGSLSFNLRGESSNGFERNFGERRRTGPDTDPVVPPEESADPIDRGGNGILSPINLRV